MKRIINIRILFLTILCLGFASCRDWLDVQPKVAVSEELLFSKEQGYKEALTGIYMSMNKTSLYGRELTYGLIDGLAQRYRPSPSIYSIDYTSPLNYQFPSTHNESRTNAIWRDGYNVIANINNLLYWLDEKGHEVTFTEGYYNIIKGEAYGLRAFMHFDLLRMWGPIYMNNPADRSIIYRSALKREDLPLESANQIIEKIIADLKLAEELLENDPMNLVFPTSVYTHRGFLDFRFKRLNKYAVKAMLARVYMYKNDKENALKYAREVINARRPNSDPMFRLVTDNTQDRVMSTELIFSLSMKDFDVQVAADFRIWMMGNYYCSSSDFVYNIFDVTVDGRNDMRLREGQGFLLGTTGAMTLKYDQTRAFSFSVLNTMPLVRLPEMHYIVAECTSDLPEATHHINLVRVARGINTVSPFQNEAERIAAIEKEYRKEFYAEGQLWYFYKRHAYRRFTGYPTTLPDLTDANYRFAIPEDEAVLGLIN
ncbi:MAG: RagB/SusD family nutrient uptake outer membrane protein [Rikenellaceae bacterium]|nr:RagB/SusD family nutrient uptake outer membrane protein [Rikenellaceae bacterium]MCL2692746.1 RagB/SusD family nutrient uptake outer membrane protein [Rikenellaceae bacterium]